LPSLARKVVRYDSEKSKTALPEEFSEKTNSKTFQKFLKVFSENPSGNAVFSRRRRRLLSQLT